MTFCGRDGHENTGLKLAGRGGTREKKRSVGRVPCFLAVMACGLAGSVCWSWKKS